MANPRSARDPRRAAALRICARLRKAGHRALLAGGCVRDELLGVTPKDYDVATDARPEQVAVLFERTVPIGAEFGVILVVFAEGLFEVTTFRRDGPYLDGRHPAGVEFCDEREDARRRDFTINALFLDPDRETRGEDAVLDYVGGREDLKKGIVRAVGNPRARFEEDHLRLLRAVRFAARLGYAIDPATWDALCALALCVTTTSAERIRDELLKMLTEGAARRAFELLDASGLLKAVLPEISAMKGVEQPPEFHPEGDVFEHTLRMLDLLSSPTPTLALGALFHDVGKPFTQTFEDRIRFNNHEKCGAEIARAICRRLRLANDDTDRVTWLVDQHMRLAATPRMRESRRKRFVREEGFRELVELCRLDCLASHGDLETIAWVEDYLARLTPEAVRPPRLISGRDLIALGYRPGPLFTEILAAVEDAQLEDELHTPEEALAWTQARWPVQNQ